jgi:hypothetical protein
MLYLDLLNCFTVTPAVMIVTKFHNSITLEVSSSKSIEIVILCLWSTTINTLAITYVESHPDDSSVG